MLNGKNSYGIKIRKDFKKLMKLRLNLEKENQKQKKLQN